MERLKHHKNIKIENTQKRNKKKAKQQISFSLLHSSTEPKKDIP